ncbi:hypothetical protein KQ945_01715 [Bacillus subtilis subsp. subtilis]|nr:hypothetical protein [Bacillus subtilis subsp. subtilis]
MSISRVVPTSFSVLDGSLRGEAEGQVASPEAVHLFAYNSVNAPLRVSPLRLNNSFRIPLQVPLNSIVVGGTITFFASASESGANDPSASVRFRPNIVLPAPVITSAVGGRNSATVHGTALNGARVQVALAGDVRMVMANGHSGDWSVAFATVPEGTHEVSAKVVDTLRTFPDSASVTRRVVAEGDIIRPLHVTSPPRDFPVKRSLTVTGVASPGRGNVRVSVGGGSVVEASVNNGNHGWYARVLSPVHGSVPLLVTLPQTGETVSYPVKVDAFGDLVVNQLTRNMNREARRQTLVAQGTISLDAMDTEVRYLSREYVWKTLAPVDEEGRFNHEVDYPTDILLGPATIDGVRHAQAASFNIPSLGDTPDDTVRVPLLFGPSELTSPLRVGRDTVLTGFDHSGVVTYGVKIDLPDGRQLRATVDPDQRWSVAVGQLPLGRLPIEISKDINENGTSRFAVARYVLDVVEHP